MRSEHHGVRTRNYAEFCDRWFNGFMHHVPEIAFKYDGTVERTAYAIEATGFAIDWPLWDRDAALCSPCHPGSNCH